MPRSERIAYLAGACDNDPLLVNEVSSLLDADDTADGFLDIPVFQLGLRIISSNSRERSNGPDVLSAASLAGTTIGGRYLVESELGHGGMGKVYLARDVTLHHRRVVIKVLREASLANPYVVQKFRQEVEALARVDHPNVVSVLGADKLPDGKPYIVMQYVDGLTLRSQIPAEGIDLERAGALLKQIGAALEDVHEQRIFHRDLKPENILLQSLKGGTELVKLVDFGIAKVKDSVVAPSTVNDARVGTVLYMSPEQLRGGERITAASDVYSMGVIAYEMVTGRRPFNPSSAPQLLELHRQGVRVNPIDLRPNLSTEARAIMLRALSFEPAARYQSAAEFGDQLARALMDCGTTVPVTRRYSTDAETIPTASTLPMPVTNPLATITSRLTGSKGTIAMVSVLVAVIGIAMAAYVLYPRGSVPPQNQVVGDPVPSGPSQSFNYWLTVQRMRDEKPYKDPFLSSGKEIFETGDEFRLSVSSPDPGYFYLFNEGPPSRTGTSFTILYPTPKKNDGDATVGANQVVQTNSNKFAGESGTENFWIVWSVSPVQELEGAKVEAFKHPDGGLTGETLIATKKFLMTKKDEVKTRYSTSRETHQTTVRGNGDVLVRLVEIEHR
jgi:serine/threonine protein kinase